MNMAERICRHIKKALFGKGLKLYQTIPTFKAQKKAFENIVGTEKNAGN